MDRRLKKLIRKKSNNGLSNIKVKNKNEFVILVGNRKSNDISNDRKNDIFASLTINIYIEHKIAGTNIIIFTRFDKYLHLTK